MANKICDRLHDKSPKPERTVQYFSNNFSFNNKTISKNLLRRYPEMDSPLPNASQTDRHHTFAKMSTKCCAFRNTESEQEAESGNVYGGRRAKAVGCIQMQKSAHLAGDKRSGQAPPLHTRRVVGWGLKCPPSSRPGQICDPRTEVNWPGVGAGKMSKAKSDTNFQIHCTPAFQFHSLWYVRESRPPIPTPSGCQRELLVPQVTVWMSLEGTQQSRPLGGRGRSHLDFQGLRMQINLKKKKKPVLDSVGPPGHVLWG